LCAIFATACSPPADRLLGNMTLLGAGLGAGRADRVSGRVGLIGWFVVAAVCLSPILLFWVGGILGRILRRKRQWRALSGRAVVADRSGSAGEDRTVDQK